MQAYIAFWRVRDFISLLYFLMETPKFGKDAVTQDKYSIRISYVLSKSLIAQAGTISMG